MASQKGSRPATAEVFRPLLDSVPDAIVLVDAAGRIALANSKSEDLFGYAPGELQGTPVDLLVPDRFRARHAGHRAAFFGQPAHRPMSARGELCGLRKDGTEFAIAINLAPVETEAGLLASAAIRDISEYKQLERQLTQRNRELTSTMSLLNNILDSSTGYSIIALDLLRNVVTWNEGARRNYGYTTEEMLGESVHRLHMQDDIDSGRVKALFDKALAGGKAEGVFERPRKSGDRFTAAVALTLRRDPRGDASGYLLISKDITEEQRLEEELRHRNEQMREQNKRVQKANRLKSEFLANMSHELRTPLNAIIGFSEVLHDAKAGPLAPLQKEFIGDVLNSARHLLQLINDVLDLAKVEAGKMEFHPESVDLGRLVAEVSDVVRTLVARKRLQVTTTIVPGLAGLVLDPGKLKQVLYNYLSNAIKFTPEGGEIAILMAPEGRDHFRVEVRDTGIGISPEDRARLFQEFQQLDPGSTKKYQGTGLGLALTKRVVEAQGGRVGIDSELGKGSAFYAVLPRQPAVTAEARAERIPADATRPAVLVVEDDPRDLDQIAGALATGGYAVQSAASGARAIALCNERAYAAITLDLLLPDMSGWDVLRAIRKGDRNRTTPVIVVSVVAHRAAAAAYAVQDYLVKPADAREILTALEQCGVGPASKVLIVDSDRHAALILQGRLEDAGYRIVLALSGDEAQGLVRSQPPDAAVIGLQVHDDGLSLLAGLRDASPHRMPVILSSAYSPPPVAPAIASVNKGHDAGVAVLAELGRLLGSSSNGARH